MTKRKNIEFKFPFIMMILGLFAISLNTNLIKVALPFFMEEYHIDTTRLIWIAISYTFFQAVFTPVLGKMGDKQDYNKIMFLGYLIFLAGSVMGVIAKGFSAILFARSIQGIGSAAVLPNTIISAPTMFPKNRRGWAVGLLTSTTASAAFMGPAIGGLLMEFAGWRSLFLINIPITVLVLSLFFFYTKQLTKLSPKPSKVNELQITARFSIILGYWIIMLNIGVYYGWGSPIFLLFVIIFLVSISYFYWQKKQYDHSFIDMKVFFNKYLFASFFSGVLGFSIKYSIAFVLPLLMAIEYGLSPGQIGLFLALSNIIRFLVTPFIGNFSDKNGSCLPVKLGFTIIFLAQVFLLSFVRDYFSGALYLSMIFLGAGSGLVDTPAVATVRENSPQEIQGTIIGFYFSLRYIFGITGQIIIGLLLQPLQRYMVSSISSPIFNRVFGFIALISLGGYLISRSLPRKPLNINNSYF